MADVEIRGIKKGAQPSSIKTHPCREMSPSPMGSLRCSAPSAPSNVRVVPWRLPVGGVSGMPCDCLGRPTWSVIARLVAVKALAVRR